MGAHTMACGACSRPHLFDPWGTMSLNISVRGAARGTVAVAATAALVGSLAPAASADGRRPTPGAFAGMGFDTCTAQDQATMDELRRESPFWAVGIYLGGQNRLCPQPHLTTTWVGTQQRRGWTLLPIWVGRQAPCTTYPALIASKVKVAERQGRASGADAVAAARRLGIPRGSTIFLDVEDYEQTVSDCNRPTLHYESGFNQRVKQLGYRGGLYGPAASTINMINYIRTNVADAYRLPRSVWFAHADGHANTRTRRQWLSPRHWATQRAKQYAIDTVGTYGSVTLDLDLNMLRFGNGTDAGPARNTCGVRLDFATYRVLRNGDRGRQVEAAQCLLANAGRYHGPVNGRFTAPTGRAVAAFQRDRDLPITRTVNAPTWTALHGAGSTPLLKLGSAEDRVRSLQRGLTAALGRTVAVSGYFSQATTAAVVDYQDAAGLPANGIVGSSTWRALKHGTV